MSATLVSLYGGLLCFSMLTYFSQAQIFHAAIENSQLLQYGIGSNCPRSPGFGGSVPGPTRKS